MLPPAGDLAILPFLAAPGSGGRGMGPGLPEDNCTRAPGLQLHHETGRLRLPFPAAPALPGENQVSPSGKTELAARGRRPFRCGEGTCPASPGRLPRASDLLPGPSRHRSGIHTNQSGGGGEPGSLQAPSPPVQSHPRQLWWPGTQQVLSLSTGLTKGPIHTLTQWRAPLILPSSQSHSNPLEKGVGQSSLAMTSK